MSHTATSTFGFGVKINPALLVESGLARFERFYPEEALDPLEFPLLTTAVSGFSPNEEYWVLVKSSVVSLYSGLSGTGMFAPVPDRKLSAEEESQMGKWMEKAHQQTVPQNVILQYFN